MEAIVVRLEHQYRRWIEFPEYTDVPKQRLFDQQRAESRRFLNGCVKIVLTWSRSSMILLIMLQSLLVLFYVRD